jgi:hypothetical protein
MKQKSDGSTAFCFGNCTMSGKGVYSSFTRYLVKKLKELGYDLYSRDEFNTSQMFPELGERVIEAGNDKIRIKYCPSIKVHIHRDIMAAENMADILVYEINGLSRPEYLSRQVVNLQKSN